MSTSLMPALMIIGLDVGHGHEDGARVEGRDAGHDGVAELHRAADHDPVHGRGDVEPLAWCPPRRRRSARRSPRRCGTCPSPSRGWPSSGGSGSRSRALPARRGAPARAGPCCARRWPWPRRVLISASLTEFLTCTRSRAWFTSGSTRARTWPRLTRSPSRTRSSVHLAGEDRLDVDLDVGLDRAHLGDAHLHVGHLGLCGLDLVLLLGGSLGAQGERPAARHEDSQGPDPEPPAHTLPLRLDHGSASHRRDGRSREVSDCVRPVIRSASGGGSGSWGSDLELEAFEGGRVSGVWTDPAEAGGVRPEVLS